MTIWLFSIKTHYTLAKTNSLSQSFSSILIIVGLFLNQGCSLHVAFFHWFFIWTACLNSTKLLLEYFFISMLMHSNKVLCMLVGSPQCSKSSEETCPTWKWCFITPGKQTISYTMYYHLVSCILNTGFKLATKLFAMATKLKLWLIIKNTYSPLAI